MLPATPENAQPDTEVGGAVWNARTRLFWVSRMICGRETQSPVLAIVDCVNAPVPGLKTRRISCGSVLSLEMSFRLVLTAAKTLPVVSACSVLRFRWSSDWPLPRRAGCSFQEELAASESLCVAHQTVSALWSLHMTPTCPLPKATTAEMSSGAGFGLLTGRTKGVPQEAPLLVAAFMY